MTTGSAFLTKTNSGQSQMARRWFMQVAIGDKLSPCPLWMAQAQQGALALDATVKVLGVSHSASKGETGIGTAFKVRNTRGGSLWVNAGWFNQPDDRPSDARQAGSTDDGTR